MRRRTLRLHMQLFIIGLCLLSLQTPAAISGNDSQPETPSVVPETLAEENLEGRWILSTDLVGRINPQGSSLAAGINYPILYRYGDEYDSESAYWQTGLGIRVNPAYGQGGNHFEWISWTFLSLRLQNDFYQSFGNSGRLLSLQSASQPFGESVMKDGHDEEAGPGHRFMSQLTLQGKIDPLILRNQRDFPYHPFSGRGPYYLEEEYYTLLKDGDYLISSRKEALSPAPKGGGGGISNTSPYLEAARAYDAQFTQQRPGWAFYWMPVDSLLGLKRPRVLLRKGYQNLDPSVPPQFFVIFSIGFDLDL